MQKLLNCMGMKFNDSCIGFAGAETKKSA